MVMVRKYLSNRERILLHLSTYSGNLNYYNAPFNLTQDGIATAIGIGRNNVPRELKTLLNEGLVEAKKARVTGLKNRRTVYHLTAKGITQAIEIRKKLEELFVKVRNSSEEEETIILKDIGKKYGVDFITAALNLNKNLEIDLVSIVRKRGKRIHYIEEDFLISHFYGRKKDMEIIEEWFKSDKKIMLITGLSGMGKTTLVLKFVKDALKDKDVFFIKIDETKSSLDIVQKLSHFFSRIGHPKLERYLRSRANSLEIEINWNTIYYLIKESMNEEVYIFDNVENATGDVKKFMKSLIDILDYSRRFKIVAIGTGINDFVPINRISAVEEMHLSELREEDAYTMLRDEGFGEKDAYKILKMYGGNPLLLSIAKNNDPRALRRFILDGVFLNLSDKEREAVEFISVFRKPIKIGALLLNNIEYSVIYSLINKNILQEMEFEVVSLHRIIKNFIYERLTLSKKKEYHLLAAQNLLEEGDVLESIYHFIQGGKRLRANLLLSEYYEKYLLEVPGQIRELATEILNSYQEGIEDHEWLLYGVIGDTYWVDGEWDLAIENYRKAEELVRNKDLNYSLRVRVRMAEIVAKRGKYREAKEILDSVLYEENKNYRRDFLAMAYYVMGNICVEMGSYDDAEEYFMKALKISEENMDYRMMGYAYNGLGILYRAQKDYNISLEYYEKALEYVESIDDKVGMVKILSNIGRVYYDMTDDKAEIYYRRANNIAEKISDEYIKARLYLSIGIWNIYKDKLNVAEKNLKKAVELLRDMRAKPSLINAYIAFGELYAYIKKGDLAKEYFDKALDIAVEIGDEKWISTVAEEAVKSLKLFELDIEKYKKIASGEGRIVTIIEK